MINESRIYKRFHLMCFIMKTEILYTRVQCSDKDNGAVFLFPCCMAAGCSPETSPEIIISSAPTYINREHMHVDTGVNGLAITPDSLTKYASLSQMLLLLSYRYKLKFITEILLTRNVIFPIYKHNLLRLYIICKQL